MDNINADHFNNLFDEVITVYHGSNDIFLDIPNPFEKLSLDNLLFAKCLIDTQQWHMEDEVRNPLISDKQGMEWKRMIDRWNQRRTDIVEKIDDLLWKKFRQSGTPADTKLNTESPAWAIDRLSILALKIYHMREETQRTDADDSHLERCNNRLAILLQQRRDLTESINELFDDYQTGKKQMQVYRQVKMYNDPSMNPVLYHKSK